VHRCASGKVLNVGIALAHLGIGAESNCRTSVLSVIGANARAAIEPELAALGLECRWIETAAETRICTTILDSTTGRTTELVENAAPLTPDELSRFRNAFAEGARDADVVVLTGSLPHVAASVAAEASASLRHGESSIGETRPRDTTFYRELLETTPARVVLDIRGPELLAALDCRPFCVKPNREELRSTFHCEFHSDADLHAVMHELNHRGAEWVVITNGPDAVWASNGARLYRFQPPEVERIINPIASGDCLAAGIAWATAGGREMPDAIRFGIAAAADNVGQLLPARLDSTRITELERQVGMF
jgi:fructose-1-phosphate kinase PfkB-like protein